MQAKFLSWQHLTKQQLTDLRAASCTPAGPSARQVLQGCLLAGQQQQQPGAADACTPQQDVAEQARQEIILDLFSYVLKQGQVC